MQLAQSDAKAKHAYFENKYGQRIDFIEGYWKLFGDVVPKYPDIAHQIYDREDYLKTRQIDREQKPTMKYISFLSRHSRVAKMKEMFSRFDLPDSFSSNLDIGTGHAITPRLIKAFGIAEEAYGLDIVDRSYYTTSEEILDFEKYIRRRKSLDRVFNKLRRSDSLLFDDRRNTPYGEFGSYIPEDIFYPDIKRKDIDLDGPILGDVFGYEGKHDLVTAFVCLEYFDCDAIMAKVSDMLVDGGVFFVYVNLWWYIINSTQLVGNFPYAVNRMERDDWVRYCEAHHPDYSESMIKIYDYFDKSHPTVSQYIETASRNGLTLMNYERCIHNQPHDPRSRLSPNYLESFFEDSYLREVLSNIRMFRSDVTLEDLQTSHVLMMFQKKARNQPLNIDDRFIVQARASRPKTMTVKSAALSPLKSRIKSLIGR